MAEKKTPQKIIPYLQTNRRRIPLTKPLWMAIVNATPDSFSDGGRIDVVGHAVRLAEQGADLLDIGGESTRPGATPVSPDEEIARIRPVLQGIFRALKNPPPLSIDTYHPETAAVALDEGVEILNDIHGLENPQMLALAQKSGAAVCFMHHAEICQNVVEEVFRYLRNRRDALLDVGIAPECLVADPGLGFGKNIAQNVALVENMARFHALEVPLLVGHSRKRFLRHYDSDADRGTQKVSEMLKTAGVQILRTHVRPQGWNGDRM